MGHVIKKIEEESPLRGKVKPGYELLSINGRPVGDVLDYKFHSYDSKLVLEFLTGRRVRLKITLKKLEGADLGLEFETYLMDRAKSCSNNCVFCFVDQMPPGMRKSLYFKDDDARLSFLMGNYITLTNLSEREAQRIIDLRISPVNVSVHTTNPELRVKMLRNKRAGVTVDFMRRFASAGITMNCQIVCCPGYNDGAELSRTVRDLAGMHPAVHSVSVVPVGLTRYRETLAYIAPFDKEKAEETIALVERFSDECKEKLGKRIFFCSDELYILAGRALPVADYYEDYAQLENGVGMLRLQEKEFLAALEVADRADGAPFSIACGVSAAPYIQKLVDAAKKKFHNINEKVFPIVNEFFGSGVNVTGLVTGRDLIGQLKGRELGDRLFIARSMLRREELDFLDDVSLSQAVRELGVPIYPSGCDGESLCNAVCGVLPEPSPSQLGSRAQDAEYYRYEKKMTGGKYNK